MGMFDAKSFARELLERDEYAQAVDAATSAMTESPDDPEAYLDRGTALDLLGRHEEAATDFARARDLDRTAGVLSDDEVDDRLFHALRAWATDVFEKTGDA